MSNVIVKMDMKSLKKLIRKEGITILKWLSDNQQDFSCEPEMTKEEIRNRFRQCSM